MYIYSFGEDVRDIKVFPEWEIKHACDGGTYINISLQVRNTPS